MASVVLAAALATLGAAHAEAGAKKLGKQPTKHKVSMTWTLTSHQPGPEVHNDWSTSGKPFGKGEVHSINIPPSADGTLTEVNFRGRNRYGKYVGEMLVVVKESDTELAPGVVQTVSEYQGWGNFLNDDHDGHESTGRYKKIKGTKSHFTVTGGSNCVTDRNAGTKLCDGELVLKGNVTY